jgi:1-deoxy-D-xylulose-5-phosphate reductoisomerase
METGGMAPGVLNAANEIAVQAFLGGRVGFLGIARLVAEALEVAAGRGLLAEAEDVAAVLATDAATRELTLHLLEGRVWN